MTIRQWRNGVWTYYDSEGNVTHKERDGVRIQEVEHSPVSAAEAMLTTAAVVGSVAVAGPVGLVAVVAIALIRNKGRGDEDI